MFEKLLLGVATFGLFVASDAGAEISTSCGLIQGREYTTKSNTACHGFLGIPFAAPPIGKLRFKRPQPAVCWESVLTATAFKPRCAQLDPFINRPPVPESEDCLYLNVFKPAVVENAKLPVMVWIHGGGFYAGSAHEYGDQGICDNLAARGVVVVTIQYRLGPLGFLATKDESSVGLWDQIEALRWVKKNIGAFGGDPDKVTIFGESAGGGSVSILSYVKEAQDLFHQVIPQSGSAFADWVLDHSVLDTTKYFFEATHCDDIECLQTKTTEELLLAGDVANKIANEVKRTGVMIRDMLHWTPRVDGKLLTMHPRDFLKTTQAKPALIGTTQSEMLLFLRPSRSVQKYMSMKTPNDELFTPDFLAAVLAQIIGGSGVDSDRLQNFAQHMAEWFYIHGREGQSTNHTFILERYSELQDVMNMNLPALREAQARAASGANTWLYNFDYYSKNQYDSDEVFKGSGHAFELPFLFRATMNGIFDFNFDAQDEQVANMMGELWTNFAKHGKPTSSALTAAGIDWLPLDASNKRTAVNLRIQAQPKLDKYFHHAATQFWDILYTTLGTEKTKPHAKVEL